MYLDIAPSGLRVAGTSVEDRLEPFVRFGSDAPIAVPTDVRNLRLARAAEICAFKGQDDHAYTVTRSGVVTRHGKVAGDQAVALSPAGRLAYVIDPGPRKAPVEYAFNWAPRPIPAPRHGTSQGIHDVDDTGHVTWGDDRLVPATFGPLTLIKWTTDGAWTWGTTPWGCGVWNAVTQRAYIAVLDAEMLWTMRGAVVGGQLVLARSLPADEVSEARFLPYDPALIWQDEPPCPVPTFAPAEHPIAVHIFGGPGFRMNLGPGHDRDPQAAPSGAFWTFGHDDARLHDQVAYARQHDVPFHAYEDKAGVGHPILQGLYAPSVLSDLWLEGRLRACVKTYPNDSLDHVLTQIRTLGSKGIKVSVCVAGYRQMRGYGPEMNWTLREVLERARAIWEYCRVGARDFVTDVLIFHQHREATPPGTTIVNRDGLDSRPELQAMADRIRAAAAAAPVVATPLPQGPPADNNPDTDTPEVPVVQPSSLLAADEVMRRGEERRSPDGRSRLVFQLDGNVVEYGPGIDDEIEPLWDSATVGDAADRLVLQADGNLVLYARDGTPLWDSGTAGHPGAVLRVMDGRGVEIVAPDGELLWSGPVITDEDLDDIFAPPPVVVPPRPRPTPRPSLGSGGLIAWLIGLFKAKPKPQAPLPHPEVPPAPPAVEIPGPRPVHRPEVHWPMVGLSHYQALGDPDFDWVHFLDFGRQHRVGYHRTWLIDAWATRDIGGLYDGFLPCRRQSDGRFDLFDWRKDYFDRLRMATDESNDRGIVPMWTLLELYSWSTRKAGMPMVPDVTRNLFHYNVNGLTWGTPDDRTFGVSPEFAGQGLPDHWMWAFTERLLNTLSSTAFVLQIGNEMPEKEMHWRFIDMLAALGYTGEIVINRNEDGPGQPFNMGMIGAGGDHYHRHEFHLGTKDGAHTAGYLDHRHEAEVPHGRPATIRELLGRVDPARIIISSDGDGGAVVPEQTALAREVLRLGSSFERQSNLKRNRFFGDGSLRMSDLDAEVPFLSQIRS